MYFRYCEKCNKQINYKNKQSYTVSIGKNKNVKCPSCRAKNKRPPLTDEHKEKLSKLFSGENNPMYGKTFKDIWKQKYNDEEINKLEILHKNKSKHIGEKHGMYGTSYYKIWIKKYGKEKADEMKKSLHDKKSKLFSGENNPMYGKPSPKRSGNGLSGWYGDFYFRSLLELGYILYLESNDIKYISGENQKYKIQYEIDGITRNYFPDFIVDDNIIEIKPKRLLKLKENIIKFEYAFKKFNNKFKILTEDDIIIPTTTILESLINDSKIVLDPSTIIKFNTYKDKNNESN